MNVKFPEPPPGSLIRFHHRGYVRFAYRQQSTFERWQVTGNSIDRDWKELEEHYPDVKNGLWAMIQNGANSGSA